MIKKKVAVIGGGDLGQQLAHFLNEDDRFSFVGFFDDFLQVNENGVLPVLGKTADVKSKYSEKAFDSILIGIGYNHLKLKNDLYEDLKKNVPFETLIHPSAIIDSTAQIKEGCIIYPGCIIDQKVKIEANSLINLGAIVSHDSVIGQSNFLAPGVVVSGFCKTSAKVFIGSGTSIKEKMHITNDVTIGLGSIVTKPILESGVYFGNPLSKKK